VVAAVFVVTPSIVGKAHANSVTSNDRTEVKFSVNESGLYPGPYLDEHLVDQFNAGEGVLVVNGLVAEGTPVSGTATGTLRHYDVFKDSKGELVKHSLSITFTNGTYSSSGATSVLTLEGTVTQSSLNGCPVAPAGEHRRATVRLTQHTPPADNGRIAILVEGCDSLSSSVHGFAVYNHLSNDDLTLEETSCVIVHGLRLVQNAGAQQKCSRTGVTPTITTEAPPPTRVTLTVNGWTLTATKAKPAVYLHHEEDQPLASETRLTIRATIDHPLPKGWTLVIYHNADVLSQGNGVWYKVCEISGGTNATSCGGAACWCRSSETSTRKT
jgi:hypothetical protein